MRLEDFHALKEKHLLLVWSRYRLHDVSNDTEPTTTMKTRTRQLNLFPLMEGAVILHRKENLTPFESLLSLRELDGLGLTVLSIDKKGNKFTIKERSGLQPRIDRLTYYDWFINVAFSPTIQACREGARPDAYYQNVSFPKRRVLRFAPHGLHEYRGKFFPQLVRSLCNIAGLEKGSTVVDPMCGSGTTLVEARALGIRAFGLDKNPLSVLISKVKVDMLAWDDVVVNDVRRQMNDASLSVTANSGSPSDMWNNDDIVYLDRWFSRQALSDISGLVAGINVIPDSSARDFARVCLSDIVIKASYQKEDELRARKNIRRYNNGDVVALFRKKYDISLSALMSTIRAGTHNSEFGVSEGDARDMLLHFPDLQGSVDAVITSPPYATALPYLDTNRLSLIVLGMLPRKEHPNKESEMIGSREISEKRRADIWKGYLGGTCDKLPSNVSSMIDTIASSHHSDKVGFRKRNLPSLLVKYFLDMTDVLTGMKMVLKNRSPAFMVIGGNSTKIGDKRVEIPTDRLLAGIAESVGFVVESETNIDMLPSKDVFKKNRCSVEKIIRLTTK